MIGPSLQVVSENFFCRSSLVKAVPLEQYVLVIVFHHEVFEPLHLLNMQLSDLLPTQLWVRQDIPGIHTVNVVEHRDFPHRVNLLEKLDRGK